MPNATNTTEDVLFQGITLNEFSPAYDFTTAQADGIGAAILRATAGEGYTDASLAANAQAARDAGLRLGFYHYLIAEDEDGARAQARYFADTIAGYDSALRPAMRFDAMSGLSYDEANRIAGAFLAEVEAITGVAPVVYTDAESACLVWNRALAEKYPLWIIDESGEAPNLGCSPWSSWVGWQRSGLDSAQDSASCGIPLSSFTDGMLAQPVATLAFATQPVATQAFAARAVEMDAEGTKLICVTVNLGDTLSSIASLFETTPEEIKKLNGIADQSIIFPGQRLFIRVADSVPYPCCDRYTVKRGDTLSGIAERFDLDWHTLASINEIRNPDRILVGQVIKLGICEDADDDEEGCTIYIVKKGDTLSGIASRFGVSWRELAQKNGISNPNRIYPGQRILIGDCDDARDPEGCTIYIVKKGDTLSGIASRYGVSWRELAQRNGISNPNRIYPGQRIVIGDCYGEPGPTPDDCEVYIVKKGDTLSGIASRYGVSWRELAQRNGISNPNRIYPGQRIVIGDCGGVDPDCRVYTVQRGDTLSGIAARFGLNWRTLASINEIKDPNRIYPGQRIKLGVC